MRCSFIRMFVISILPTLLLVGCSWRDDFRQRVQPQALGEKPKPTFNQDSLYYVGDEVAYPEDPAELVDMDQVDGLSEIPPLPENATILGQ